MATTKTELNYELTLPLMAKISNKTDSSELIALVCMRREGDFFKPTADNPIFVLFDRPSNKGNLGTLIRSCDAFGVSGLILTGHGVDPYDPDVVTSTIGSFFKVPFARLTSNAQISGFLLDLKKTYPALTLIGTTAHNQVKLYEANFTGPVVILVGNETDGLNQHFTALSDTLVTIPMVETATATSLNVSCAVTTVLYETLRQRKLM